VAKPRAKSKAASKREAAVESARYRRAIRVRLALAFAGVVVLGLVLFTASRNGPRDVGDTGSPSGAGECVADTHFDEITDAKLSHVANPTYEVEPPAGGPHTPTAAPPGFYKPGKQPSDGQLVHSMEHGFVVVWYKADLGEAELDVLADIGERYSNETLIVPRSSLRGEIAVTAWHHRLLCKRIDAAAIAKFIEDFRDKGPEKGFL
jgi:hypothetical protein